MMLIIAQETLSRSERWKRIPTNFRESDPNTIYQIVAVFVLFLLAVGAIWWLDRWQRRRTEGSGAQPMILFMNVLKQLGVPLRDRWLLGRVVRKLKLEHPTSLLISPVLFDKKVEEFLAAAVIPGGKTALAAQFTEIRRILFQPQLADPSPAS